MIPATGGQYVYLREAYGPLCAFVSNWTFMLAVLSGGSAWLAVTFSIYVGYFVRVTPWEGEAIAVVLIGALSGGDYLGVKEGARGERTVTCLKVGARGVLACAQCFSVPSAASG